MQKLSITICVVMVWAGLAQAAPDKKADYKPVIEKYAALLEQEMQKMKIVGAGVALVDSHGVIWARGFGSENLADHKPATTNTLFGIGSMTKVITATAVMQLNARHALDIDKPMADQVPSFSIKSRFSDVGKITPRHILTHHAGIPGDIMKVGEGEDFRSFPATVRDMHATFPPGYVDCYSNLGFSLLGNLIEQASRERYETYVAEHIFKPCGMKTARINANVAGIPNLSKAYNDASDEREDHYVPYIPTGSVFASVNDMASFMCIWLNKGKAGSHAVLDSAMVEEMYRLQNRDVVLDLGKGRGLCWDLEDGEAGRVYSHGGALLCFRSQMVVAPECDLAAVMLVNTASGGGITWRTKELVNEAAAIKGEFEKKRQTSDPLRKPEIKSVSQDRIPGVYAADFLHFTITKTNSELIADINGAVLRFQPVEGTAYKMQYRNGDSFVDLPGETYYFPEINGTVMMLQEKWGTKNNAGVQIKVTPIDAAWRGRLGKYKVTQTSRNNWFEEAELTLQNDMLVLVTPLTSIKETAPFQLIVDDEQMAHVPGLNRYSGNVAEFRKNGMSEELWFMGMVLRKN